MTTSNPYQAPSSDIIQAYNKQPYQPKIFTTKGRIGRLRYLAYGVISYLCLIPLGILVALTGGFSDTGDSGSFEIAIIIVGYIAMLLFMFVLAKRRLNDLNKSGWLSLLLIIPVVNLFVALWLIFAAGKKEQNNYGPHPVKNSIGITLIGLTIPAVALIGIITAISLPAYQDYVKRAAAIQTE